MSPTRRSGTPIGQVVERVGLRGPGRFLSDPDGYLEIPEDGPALPPRV
jgi:hypothetical protein